MQAIPATNMVLISAGEFEMGSNDAEADNDEQPVRKVYVDAFYMDETEVTNLQFKEFLLENPRWQKGRVNKQFADDNYLKGWDGNNYLQGKNYPVIYVSWYAAMAYAEWADKRLPTEAEWEYAARGGLKGKKYPNGNTITGRDANFGGRNPGVTTPVDKYPANGYGLYDMAGNVWEWCLDEYDSEFYFTFPRNGVARNPLSGANSVEWILNNYTQIKSTRVRRGGSWSHSARLVRCAQRGYGTPSNASSYLGFRCARTVSP